jgi:LmbE family N-acetylglucosaminyl deacetylase
MMDRRQGGGEVTALTGRTILAVFAHPDDESIACGGTLARAADAGARVVLMCASHGTLGSVSDTLLLVDGDLSATRAQELSAAACALGLSEVELLDHADGYLRWNAPAFDDDLIAALRRYRPDAVITFDTDGLYWHGDHIGVHERTTGAVAALGGAAPPLYYVTMPHGAMRGLVESARARVGPLADNTFWGIVPDAFGSASEPPTFTVDVRDWVDQKLTAIRCHRTQVGPRSPFAMIDGADARRWLGLELFRRSQLEASGPDLLESLAERAANS